jgi:hypothetical protein
MPALFLIVTVALIVLCGLAWHDKAAHQPVIEPRGKPEATTPRQLSAGKDALI